MEIDIYNLEKFKEFITKFIDLNEHNQRELNELETSLTDALTNYEIFLFNRGMYFDIIPILYLLENIDETGLISVASTEEHKSVMLQDCGMTLSEFNEFNLCLRRVHSGLYDELI